MAIPPERSYKLPTSVQAAILAGGLAIVVAVFVIIPLVHSHYGAVAKAPDYQPEPGSFVATDEQWAGLQMVAAQAMPFRSWDDTDGKIATNDDITTAVFSQYSGRVRQVFVKAGDVVAAGTPLLEVDASEFVQGQDDLIAASAQSATARAQLHLAQVAEKRQHDLLDAKGGSLKDWQQSQVDLATAEGAARTAEAALSASRNRLKILGRRDDEIAAIEAGDHDQRMPAVAVVRAPISGTVILRQVGVGQFINSLAASGTELFLIGDLSSVWLVANVRETDAPHIKLGQTFQVRVMAFPDKVFEAVVTYVAPTINPDTRRLGVRAEMHNPNGELKPEMFASFRIQTGGETSVTAIPESAILYEGDKARVWVAKRDHSIGLRHITTGRHAEAMTEVVEGLAPGELVVTKGALFIDRASKLD